MSKKRSIWDEPCLCGCGHYPKHGIWLPGHDSIHKSRLLKRVRDNDDRDAADELVHRGWLSQADVIQRRIDGLAR